MRPAPRPTAIVGLLCSPVAMAADPHGLLTLVVGIPLMLGACVVLGIMLFLPKNRIVKRVTAVLFLPVLIYSGYVALDAVTLLRDLGSENSMIGLTFLGLLAVDCLLFVTLLRWRARSDPVR
ncbi:hypothetical protein [Variovorax ginsengisoli]|uniref:FtsH-binding integral membrane protein n=1 Tax=Variovorax ginsengisoli TaxID=363844 RepID=A0ABT9SA94_9BURK|nr:hypothetical protein [Variovorax ginsengisoli]MDP9900814.1 FtsH-binding integral membrane protein [Variovorax ginsengisoli]